MKLSEFLTEVGAPLYYYPSLAKIYGVKGAIFLCNFIAWTGSQKDPNGWIYKSQSEIEKETGLNDEEQATARNRLKKLGVIEEKYIRLEHKMLYRVVVDKVDFIWANRKTRNPESGNPGMGNPGKAVSSNPGKAVSSIEALSTKDKQALNSGGGSESNGTLSIKAITITPGTHEATQTEPSARFALADTDDEPSGPPNGGVVKVVSPQPCTGVLGEDGLSSHQNGTPDEPTANVAPIKAVPEPAEIVLNHLNQAAGRNFRMADSNLKPIAARLKSVGGDVQGVCKMIDRQVKKWKGGEMADYLRPETLFRASKFDGYYDDRDQPVYSKPPNGHAKPSGPPKMNIQYKEDTLPP